MSRTFFATRGSDPGVPASVIGSTRLGRWVPLPDVVTLADLRGEDVRPPQIAKEVSYFFHVHLSVSLRVFASSGAPEEPFGDRNEVNNLPMDCTKIEPDYFCTRSLKT